MVVFTTSHCLQTKCSGSPISRVFQGQIRSTVHQHGSRESATLQPFFSLQLDIQVSFCKSTVYSVPSSLSRFNIHAWHFERMLMLLFQSDKVTSVKDALEYLVKKESLEDYTCSKTKVEVSCFSMAVLQPVRCGYGFSQ